MKFDDEDKEGIVDYKETPRQLVASAQSFGSFEEVIRAMMELFRWVLMNGGKVASYPLARYPDIPESPRREAGSFEVCVPIEDGIRDEGDVKIKSIPGITVAYSRHLGSLEDIHETYSRILKWIEENGFELEGTSREIYLTSPLQDEVKDLVTEVQIPVGRPPGSIH